jgi:NAD(P)-dependent dehydrogenase (short-subunit alcohol dehydrogenase family)
MENGKAIVTGASRGIGKGIALSLAKKGDDIAFSYASREDEAEKTAVLIEEAGRKAYCFGARLHEPGAVRFFQSNSNGNEVSAGAHLS